MVEATLKEGVVGRAFAKGLLKLQLVKLRDYAKQDVHKSVDDRPYGGGDGMVMMPEPLAKALDHAKSQAGLTKVIYLSPQGKLLNQKLAQELASFDHLIILSGRYAGIDERLLSHYVDEEISIGDYVLSGGELAAAVLIDAVARFKPGVLGHEESAEKDSLSGDGLLEAPLFTRPRSYENMDVPEVLLSGDHKKIDRWKYLLGVYRTSLKRPDLWKSLIEKNQNLASELLEAKKEVAKLSQSEKRACGISDEKDIL